MGRIEKALERMKSQKLGQEAPAAAPSPVRRPATGKGSRPVKSGRIDASGIAQVVLDQDWLLDHRVITDDTDPSVRRGSAAPSHRERRLQADC